MKLPDAVYSYLAHKAVWVVDPQLNYRSCCKRFLNALRIHDIKVAPSLRDLKIEATEPLPGLFIVEWSLPHENGIQYCRKLRQDPQWAGVPFLLMSVDNHKKDVILASEVGIDGYLVKPFSIEDFASALCQAVYTRVYPDSVNARLAQADLMLLNHQLGEAEAIFHEVLDEKPSSARALCGLGSIASKRGQIRDAINLYRRAMAANAQYLEPYRALVDLYYNHGSRTELMNLVLKLNSISPDNPKYTLILAQTSMAMGNFKDSENYFKRTIRLSPKLAEAYKGLGKLNLIQQDYTEAMKNLTKALDLSDGDVSILSDLGLAYIKCGCFKDGIEKYEAALRVNPKDSNILFGLAAAKEQIGDLKDAEYYYMQALARNPGHKEALRRLEGLQARAS